MRRITLLLLLATTATCYGQSNTDIPADQAPSGSSYIDEDRPQIEQATKKANESNRTTQRLNTLIVSDRMRKSKLCDVNSNQKVHLARPFNIILADNTSRPNAPPFLVQDM